ncbi:hypothetical protein ACLOJK_016273 [Asimina triloba]
MERSTSTADESGAFDWWREIDESDRWQSIIFRTLCAVYALVACIALVRIPFFSLPHLIAMFSSRARFRGASGVVDAAVESGMMDWAPWKICSVPRPCPFTKEEGS